MSLSRFTSEYLKEDGPIIKVWIYPPEPIVEVLKEENKPIPGKEAKALIDTGASSTCIPQSIAESLGLVSHDLIRVQTPTNDEYRELFDISLTLPQTNEALFSLACPCVDFHGDSHNVLLGRDVLEHCTLIYNGWDKSFHVHT